MLVFKVTLVLFLLLLIHGIKATEVIQNKDEQNQRILSDDNVSKKNSMKPNILLIFADDVGIGDIPGYFKSKSDVNMPNINNLMAHGTSFFDFHSTPLCATSRYVLLSGNYQDRGKNPGGTWSLNYRGSQFLHGQMSLAQVLRDNGGYHTAMLGKWHLGGKIPTTSSFHFTVVQGDKAKLLSNKNHNWTRPIIQGPQDIGFVSSYITTGGIQDPPYKFVRDGMFENPDSFSWWEADSNHTTDIGVSIIGKIGGEGSDDWDSSAYNMILVNETERFIIDHKENHADQPFFAYVALGAVHIPHSPPFNYTDGSQVAGVYPTGHMDMLGEMDMVVGSLLQILEKTSTMNDTIVVFTSDNGGLTYSKGYGHHSNFPFRGTKGEVFEGGHRVPLVIRWNNGNIPQGESRDRLLGLNDLFATLCDLAGVTIPQGQAKDSISFSEYLKDRSKKNSLRKYLRIISLLHGGINAVRYGQYKLHIDRESGKPLLLYDLEKDPSESINLLEESDWYKYQYLIHDMLHHMKLDAPQSKYALQCIDHKKSFMTKDGKNIRCNALEKYQCKNPVVKNPCPVTCGSCYELCKDVTKRFWIGPKQLGKTTCRDVYKNNMYMCNKRSSVRINCPVTCDSCPSSKCQDTSKKILVSGKYKTCSEITYSQCDLNSKVLKNKCPRTCGLCNSH